MTTAPQASPVAATITAGSELRAALASCRSALVGIALFSGLINLLGLTGSLFMLEVYDRVLPSRSVPTLVGLAIITALLFVFQGILELVRGRMLVRSAARSTGASATVFMIWWCACRCARAAAATDCSRYATSTPFARCCQAPGRPPCSTCHGCRSIWRSALRFTPDWPDCLGWGICAGDTDATHRSPVATVGAKGLNVCGGPQPVGGSQPTQRGSRGFDGNVGATAGPMAPAGRRLSKATEDGQ